MTDLDFLWRKHAATVPGLLASRPDFRFDPAYYAGIVPAMAAETPAALARHYQDYGQNGGHRRNFYAKIHAVHADIDKVLANLIVDADLAAAISTRKPGACELACELIHLGAPTDAKLSNFSMRRYLETYQDIDKAGMDPLEHYLLYGAQEGRLTLAELRQSHYRGRCGYISSRPTCLIVVHECSRTGAPIVGLDLAREAARSHNVVIAALREGPLLESFRDYACDVVITLQPLQDFTFYTGASFEKIDLAILNSVETHGFVPMLVAREIPFVAYVHEYADYSFPAYKSTFIALFSDLLMFSSEHVRDNWAGRLKDIEFDIARDSRIVPQRGFAVGGVDAVEYQAARARLSGLLGRDLTSVRLVCGAGHLQWRKGTDIFAMAAQIVRPRDPDTVFLWIGDGLNAEDIHYGVWMTYHLRQIGEGQPDSNLFFLPAGPAYLDVLAASDAMFVSSRLDPLPNVVFDALDRGCRIVQFEGASGFGDSLYRASDHLVSVEYANPEAAANALLALPRKTPIAETAPLARPELFAQIRATLAERLAEQRYFVRGASPLDVPVLFSNADKDRPLRTREREKMLRYRRRLLWRDLEEVATALAQSDNWVHRNLRLAPYGVTKPTAVPAFSMHIHAFYTDNLADDLALYQIYAQAQRIVVTTDTAAKGEEISRIMAARGLNAEIVLVTNRGRDILPFLELFHDGGAAGEDEIWCHLHQKKSLTSTTGGDTWRRFLMRILLGNDAEVSGALHLIGQQGVGLVAPFDPNHVPWNATRALLQKFATRLPGPMPDNPLLFPVGNMFWTRRSVVLAMNEVFGQTYPWPNEPIANDGTEFHLIERLWPALTTHLGLESVFVHKLDEKRG